MAISDYVWSLVPGDRSGALCTCVIPNKQQQPDWSYAAISLDAKVGVRSDPPSLKAI